MPVAIGKVHNRSIQLCRWRIVIWIEPGPGRAALCQAKDDWDSFRHVVKRKAWPGSSRPRPNTNLPHKPFGYAARNPPSRPCFHTPTFRAPKSSCLAQNPTLAVLLYFEFLKVVSPQWWDECQKESQTHALHLSCVSNYWWNFNYQEKTPIMKANLYFGNVHSEVRFSIQQRVREYCKSGTVSNGALLQALPCLP